MTDVQLAPPPPAPDEDQGLTRRPPHDLEAEASVLGAGMLTVEAIEDAIGAGLKAEDFYVPRHGVVFEAMVGMFEAGEVCDAVTLADTLRADGSLTRVGGPAYLHTLMSEVPTAANAGYYARIVHEQAILRRVITKGARIVELGYARDGGDVSAIVDAAQAEALSLSDGMGTIGIGIADDLDSVIDRIETGVNTTPTPWADLNALIGGWVRGNLYVFGARPGGGKSIAGLQAALDMARRHAPACFVSLEMTEDQIIHRAFSQLGQIDLGHLARGGDAMSERDWHSIARARRILETNSTVQGTGGPPVMLQIVDTTGATLSDIRAAHRATARRWGTEPGLLVVDYLQLMHSSRRVESRQQEVAAFARGLKELAKALNVAVVALCQLNRDPASGNRKPVMSDLRESGEIEQAADVIVLQSREKDDDGNDTDRVIFDCVKDRQGPVGEVVLRWDARFSRILTLARDEDGRMAL